MSARLGFQFLWGGFSSLDGDVTEVAMDPVWETLPENLQFEVVGFLPHAKIFQLHVVSRRWRNVLSSPTFRIRNSMVSAPVVGIVFPPGREGEGTESEGESSQGSEGEGTEPEGESSHTDDSEIADDRDDDRNQIQFDIELKMVPLEFWSCKYQYTIVAAAHGLVCISNDSSQYCVLNPLTRTARLLPQPPFKAAVCIIQSVECLSIAGELDEDRGWRLATFYLTAHNNVWVCAAVPMPMDRNYSCWCHSHALLGGVVYCYNVKDNTVRQLTAPGNVVQFAEVHPALHVPSVTLLGLHEEGNWRTESFRQQQVYLTEHRGILYFVAAPWTNNIVCAIWRLAWRDGGLMQWEGVALLKEEQLQKLTARTSFRHLELTSAYGVNAILCCQVGARVEDFDSDDPDAYSYEIPYDTWLVGFNLNTLEWQLMCAANAISYGVHVPIAMECRPDVFFHG